ncbi:hypothetical protein [Rhizobium leguminosarum]|uniref:hypothetical protein n=1 Tax=Rhizobium TaxID=379 RepID=UPI001F41AA57|nr:hypothetical protein [Rhizobium leguminosarum]UIK20636.1 hypothetical protein LZK79_29225 [Rhizobium leguminosarum]
MLEIRPAETADHEEIVQLWHQGWHDAHADLVPSEVLAFRTKDDFPLWLKEAEDAFFVATDDTGVLGFVSAKGAEVVKLYVQMPAEPVERDVYGELLNAMSAPGPGGDASEDRLPHLDAQDGGADANHR